MKRIAAFMLLHACAAMAQEGWWMTQPLRWVQTNLRETDANLDAQRLIDQLTDFKANVLHFGMGGIAAYYPTKVPFHYPSPYLPKGRDLFGEVLELAHKRGIRVVGRFDLSKTRKEVFDAHPEWFFRKANGEPVVYNELYSTCINGGYYRDLGMKILAEALENYDVDGLFFNMFGNQSRDYSGTFVGHCHCDSCKRKYREMYGKDLPKEPDDDYRRFMFHCSREVAAEIGKLIRTKRPKAGYFNYIQEHTDGIMSESNTAVNRPLPLWPYASSDNVNRARNSEPTKMSVNLCMQFVDFPWRFATVPQQEIALRLWQNVAHGGAAAFAVNGTLDQQDMQAIQAAKPVYQWLAANEQYYVKQQSAAKVLLLGGSARLGRTLNTAAYRGVFRFLSEEHIPFAVSDNMDWLEKRDYDLVIATEWAPAELKTYLEQGGKVLVVSARPPELPVPAVVQTWKNVSGYFRVRNHQLLPSLKDTTIVMLNGDYTEVAGDGSDSLTFIPPSMIGPPEKIHTDMKETTKPGLVRSQIGKGRLVWVPWDLSVLYYKHSLPAHAGILRDLIADLMPERQIVTNAHPLVEMSLMRQGNRTLLHLINLSGHSQTAYFEPLPMRDIEVKLAGKFLKATAIRNRAALAVTDSGGRSRFVLPELKDYELIVLE